MVRSEANRVTGAVDVGRLGTILGVWAHPDDESFMAAGLMATAVRQGQRVVCMTATRGEAGVQDEARWPAATLGAVRTREMQAGLDILGVREHHWLDYADGGCSQISDQEGVGRVGELIAQVRPDTILTFGPDGLTGHPDHQTVSRWATEAAKASTLRPRVYYAVTSTALYEQYLKEADKKVNMFFNIDQPLVVEAKDCAIAYELPADIAALKVQALGAMPSQLTVFQRYYSPDWLGQAFGCECFVEADA